MSNANNGGGGGGDCPRGVQEQYPFGYGMLSPPPAAAVPNSRKRNESGYGSSSSLPFSPGLYSQQGSPYSNNSSPAPNSPDWQVTPATPGCSSPAPKYRKTDCWAQDENQIYSEAESDSDDQMEVDSVMDIEYLTARVNSVDRVDGSQPSGNYERGGPVPTPVTSNLNPGIPGYQDTDINLPPERSLSEEADERLNDIVEFIQEDMRHELQPINVEPAVDSTLPIGVILDGIFIKADIWTKAHEAAVKARKSKESAPCKAAQILFDYLFQNKSDILNCNLNGKSGKNVFQENKKLAVIRGAIWLFGYKGEHYFEFDYRKERIHLDEDMKKIIVHKVFTQERNQKAIKLRKTKPVGNRTAGADSVNT